MFIPNNLIVDLFRLYVRLHHLQIKIVLLFCSYLHFSGLIFWLEHWIEITRANTFFLVPTVVKKHLIINQLFVYNFSRWFNYMHFVKLRKFSSAFNLLRFFFNHKTVLDFLIVLYLLIIIGFFVFVSMIMLHYIDSLSNVKPWIPGEILLGNQVISFNFLIVLYSVC